MMCYMYVLFNMNINKHYFIHTYMYTYIYIYIIYNNKQIISNNMHWNDPLQLTNSMIYMLRIY